MRWFRRNLDDFGPFDWSEDEGRLTPLFPQPLEPRPEPWRDHDRADEFFVVPVGFAQIFSDRKQVNRVKRFEAEYINQLRESIRQQGLREPALMYYDEAGKVRYHDGYHRMAAIEGIEDFERIPVILTRTSRVKGYGRPLAEEVLRLFEMMDDPQKRQEAA